MKNLINTILKYRYINSGRIQFEPGDLQIWIQACQMAVFSKFHIPIRCVRSHPDKDSCYFDFYLSNNYNDLFTSILNGTKLLAMVVLAEFIYSRKIDLQNIAQRLAIAYNSSQDYFSNLNDYVNFFCTQIKVVAPLLVINSEEIKAYYMYLGSEMKVGLHEAFPKSFTDVNMDDFLILKTVENE